MTRKKETMMAGMTKGERTELGSLIRKREKVMKAQAQERSAALLSQFESQAAHIFHFDEDEVWEKAMNEALATVKDAQRIIAERCKAMGIPEEFSPTIRVGWDGGGATLAANRLGQLRRAAKAKIEAMEKEAITKIERLSLEAQTQILASSGSEAAQAFLNQMPSLDTLMPPIEVGEIQSLIEPSVRNRSVPEISWHDRYN